MKEVVRARIAASAQLRELAATTLGVADAVAGAAGQAASGRGQSSSIVAQRVLLRRINSR